MKTAGYELELLNVGAFDQRNDVLQTHSAAMFDYLEEVMSEQSPSETGRIERDRIQEIRRIFDDACGRVNNLRIPNSVVHGDMNLGNILMGSGQCQFTDWCETYIGNPLVTLEHLLLLNQETDLELRTHLNRSLRDRYRDTWSEMCDPLAIEEGFAYMPLLAMVSTLYGRGDWLATSSRYASRRRAYARNLGRHMDRVARDPVLLGALRA